VAVRENRAMWLVIRDEDDEGDERPTYTAACW
jgi:hypothetical protein